MTNHVDPRIEAMAEHFAAVTGEPRAGRFEYTMARAALAAADKAATIPTMEELRDFLGSGRTTPTPTLETRIAETLAASDSAHQFKKAEQMNTDYPHFWCSCGVQTIGRGKFPEHVRQASAAALAPVIAEVRKDERQHVIQDIRDQAEHTPDQVGDYGRVELEGYLSIGTREVDKIENGAGFDRMCMSVTEWETGMDKVAADALSEAANELRVDPSAEPGTSKRIYNTIYATWLEERADKLVTE